MGRTCATDECLDLTDGHGDYCPTCRKRRQRGTDSSKPRAERLGGFAPVVEAAARLMDAETEDQYLAAKAKLRRAAKAWKGD